MGRGGRGLAGVPSLFAPATVEVAMLVKPNSTCLPQGCELLPRSAGVRPPRATKLRRCPLYLGLSRCTTFTLYPAFRRRLFTSSAIITERCCPPVHPKLIVR